MIKSTHTKLYKGSVLISQQNQKAHINVMNAYLIKITAKNVQPPVWWKLFIPSGISFSSLSIIVDEIANIEHQSDFRFIFYQKADIYEPTDEHPLTKSYQNTVASASENCIMDFFDKEKTATYHNGYAAFKIEIVDRCDFESIEHPTLENLRTADVGDTLSRMSHILFKSVQENIYPTQKDLISQSKDNTYTIPVCTSSSGREGAYIKSGREELRGLIDSLDTKAAFFPENRNFSTRYSYKSLLECYKKSDLLDLAMQVGIPGYSKMNSSQLVSELCFYLPQPAVMKKFFCMYSDEVIEVFEKALKANGSYSLPENERNLLDYPSYNGYVFYGGKHSYVDIPKELNAAYEEISTPEFKETRAKVKWVMNCLNKIVPPYYAVIPMAKFCRICRRSSAPEIKPEEVPGLLRFIPEEEKQCVIRDDLIMTQQLYKDFEIYSMIRKSQEGKQYYIMRQHEIEDILKNGYPSAEPSHKRCKAFLMNEFKLCDSTASSLTSELHLLCVYRHKFSEAINTLSNFGIELSESQLKELTAIYMQMSNNSPSSYNCGYTPSAMYSAGNQKSDSNGLPSNIIKFK